VQLTQPKANKSVTDISASCVTNTYAYDGFARRTTATDGRGNTSRTVYNSFGQTEYTEDAASNRTAYAYDGLGRQVAVSSPLSNTVFTAYDSLGNVIRSWGAAYPVEYGFDSQGRKISMKTFRVENGNGDETRWLYDSVTGLLTNKVYADGKGTAYGYTASGRLAARAWARGVTTGYAYDAFGQLTVIDYSDATPDVTFAYDRIGNMLSVSDASGTRVFTHDLDGQTLSDTLSALGQDFVLLESRDAFGRGSGYALSNTVNGVAQHISGMLNSYDPFGRIAQVTVDGVASPFRYGYLAGTDLRQSLAMPNGVTCETEYEPHHDLPDSFTHTNALGTILTRRTFTRDAAGNLTGRTQYRLGDATNRVDEFSQNARSELVYAAVGTNIYNYAFDPIGNRLTTDESGLSAAYSANCLNQYTRISNSVPLSEFIPEFDADGNQTLLKTATGIWRVIYNAENRPILFSNDTVVVEMAYDYQGRRFRYREIVNGVITRHEHCLYRSYLQIATLDLLDGTNVQRTIAWDPSETTATRPLVLKQGSNWWSYGFDQIKNVTELLDVSGTLAATYDYTPFGAVAALSGAATAFNPITFSSEIGDSVLGLVHYNYRPLDTLNGRWISRDLIEEDGGLNLYEHVANNSITHIDVLGLSQTKPTIPQTGFAVIANVVEIESIVGKILQTLGIDHVDITYNGSVIYVGAHGGIARQYPKSKIVNNVYPLQKKRFGYLKYGTSGKCTKCKDATDSQITQCLKQREPNLGMNCQGDVQGATKDCCLKGFRTFVSTVFPYWD